MTPALAASPWEAATLPELISRIWQIDPANLRPRLTEKECQAVELFASRVFFGRYPRTLRLLWERGLDWAYSEIWVCPNSLGLGS